ncbi:uroporphyrinogen-III C-methyltransferase [Denitromonas iodatirespirans]|uniref:uroporphyrinogen-III C-methyltransferase n=1 Tax=Denitromonas iodatirespirans TaxID=2795389 RepID=A0A944HBL1_DENI1|nr:uroporphyrinogen-III C-methyltransferase [Denitromonas iodatirespirans]MBT0961777.1 uroporphyrinogen-III C-methyltransferase [Denitromonas iodatirespirans]
MRKAIDNPARPGWVYLVGAGPGDAELLTLRAARLLSEADVVVYDNLVGPDVMALLPDTAERRYVGKKAADHALPQDEICALLVALAREGKRVVRLKGGDPYVFGRGGEEAEALVDAGVPFEVVPGITAAAGVSAYTGIPLTHREHAQSVVFATGYGKEGAIDLDWPALARPNQTVVIYMGVSRIGEICRELMRHGLPPETPAAMVRHGTLPAQRVITATLADLGAKAAAAKVKPPALMLVGTVIELAEKLAWFKGSATDADPD